MNKKLSVVIIAKNEEKMIADSIESVRFSDEILVIDNESLDRTADVAKHLGAKVITFKSSNFSEMRNFGISKAKYPYVLYVDSDERVSDDLAKNIQQAVISEADISGFIIQRKNFYFGNHEWPQIESFPRLFKKADFTKWEGTLHETPHYKGESKVLNGYLLHFTHRNLSQMLNKTIDWSEKEAYLRFTSHHPKMTWWRFPRVMATGFMDSYIKQKGYKAKTAGIVEATYQMYSMFITYARLWELQNNYENSKKTTK